MSQKSFTPEEKRVLKEIGYTDTQLEWIRRTDKDFPTRHLVKTMRGFERTEAKLKEQLPKIFSEITEAYNRHTLADELIHELIDSTVNLLKSIQSNSEERIRFIAFYAGYRTWIEENM